MRHRRPREITPFQKSAVQVTVDPCIFIYLLLLATGRDSACEYAPPTPIPPQRLCIPR